MGGRYLAESYGRPLLGRVLWAAVTWPSLMGGRYLAELQAVGGLLRNHCQDAG